MLYLRKPLYRYPLRITADRMAEKQGYFEKSERSERMFF